jgi:hypothetical protein
VREAFDKLVLPLAQLEQVQHLAHALADTGAVDAEQAAVEPQETRRP